MEILDENDKKGIVDCYEKELCFTVIEETFLNGKQTFDIHNSKKLEYIKHRYNPRSKNSLIIDKNWNRTYHLKVEVI